MFAINWIRRVLSLPLVVLGHLLNFFAPPMALAVLRAAYAVGPEPMLGQTCLAIAYRVHPRPQARQIAQSMCRKRFMVEPAVFWGLCEVEDDPANARAILEQCRQFPPDRLGLIELLEMALTEHENGDVGDIARRLETRRDLSPQVSKLVLLELARQELLKGRAPQAAARAYRILAIEDDAQAELILGFVAEAAGRQDDAARHLRKAQALPEKYRLYYQVSAYIGLGRFEQAQPLLEALRQADDGLAQKAERLLQSKRKNARLDDAAAGDPEPAARADRS